MGNLEAITEELNERGFTIIGVAKSKKDKYHLIATFDDIETQNSGLVRFYNILDYEHTSLRGNFDGGNSVEEARMELETQVKNWNRYNTKLGKLEIVR